MASVTGTGFCAEAAIGSAQRAEDEPKESKLSQSIRRIIGESLHVVIYGYGACGYRAVWHELKEEIKGSKSPLLGCYNCADVSPTREPISIDGHFVIKSSHPEGYKAGLLSVLLENCKRIRRGESIIPVLFCVISSAVPQPFSPENANIKEAYLQFRRSHTSRELNLAYKLCYDPKLTEEIHEVAKKTFIFVKTNGPQYHPSELEDTGLRIDDSWDAALKREVPKERGLAKPDWRAWLTTELEKFAGGSHG
jgi:hypothetical protein